MIGRGINPKLFVQKKIARFRLKHGYWPNLKEPKKYSEKLLYRILYKRDPHYKLFGCKLTAPIFARDRTDHDLRFPKRLKVFRELPHGFWRELPDKFVLKGSYSSGLNKIIKNASKTDFKPIRRLLNRRVRKKRNSQGVNDPHAVIIAEELIQDSKGKVPTDYKFHCFRNGKGSFRFFLQIDIDRMGNHDQILVDEKMNILPFSWENMTNVSDELPEVPNFEKMVAISRDLSKDFNYIRLDYYSIDDEVYFGEFTPFHRAAMSPIACEEWEFKLGQLWVQDRTNHYFYP